MQERLRYFAYGSNMLTEQMADRCPGACDPAEAVLADHTWICNEQGVATVVPVQGRPVHGLLWDVMPSHIKSLDGYEGVAKGHYRRETIGVTELASGRSVDAFIYIACNSEPGPPRPGYMDKVIGGATEHRLPEWWLTYLRGWVRTGNPPSAGDGLASGPRELDELLALPGVTEEVRLGSRFGFMAIHGGDLEVMTDVIAQRAAEASGASLYYVHHPADIDHHLPSIRYLPDRSSSLDRFLDHVDVAVSLHGYGRRGRWTDVMVGGTNRDLAGHVARHVLRELDGYNLVVDLTEFPQGLRGQHPDNPVNRPTGGGVQLEVPPRLRGLSPLSPPPGPDGLSPPTRSFIEGLAGAARSWSA
jgi:phage replication-related protein YjqB (UPF0714/DUF867 family)